MYLWSLKQGLCELYFHSHFAITNVQINLEAEVAANVVLEGHITEMTLQSGCDLVLGVILFS